MLDHLAIAAPVPGLAERVQATIDAKTKPPGSLGRIEALALQMAVAQGTEIPESEACLLLIAGDHGLVAEGVSAWPSDVTAQMVQNFISGGAAANVFARAAGAQVIVADAGVAGDLPSDPSLRRAGIRRGTRNAAVEDALTPDEVAAALAFGAGLAGEAVTSGARVIAIGEMGIGNTSSAALLGRAIADLPLERLVGPGAGLPPSGVARKLDVLQRAANRHPHPMTPEAALAAYGGLEIAAMAGAAIAAASDGAVVLVDGFISTAAAMAALAARPELSSYLVYAHRGHEPGHRALLGYLGGEALLDLDMRLGEGSGALLAVPLLKAATAMLREMATFESAGVSGKDGA
ncbi:MAG: nicotinate-nucleotide--dimethylbenzimidazole phosphoribosyltransferase [Pseudomonadota bacterium]